MGKVCTDDASVAQFTGAVRTCTLREQQACDGGPSWLTWEWEGLRHGDDIEEVLAVPSGVGGGGGRERGIIEGWGGLGSAVLRGADSSVVDVPVILQLQFQQFH